MYIYAASLAAVSTFARRVFDTGPEFRHDNHYVPCAYLKHWASAGGRVWTYRTLVSHPSVPTWKRSSPAGIAKHSHLYTSLAAGRETDEIERWLDREIETPAQEALDKATSDARLTPKDWRRLLRYLAAQDVRTPAWFEHRFKQWTAEMPDFIAETLRNSVRKIEEASESGRPLPRREPVGLDGPPMCTKTMFEPGEDMGQVGTELLLGRGLWLYEIRLALESTWKALTQHRWTILKPPDGTAWFTSDNPVVRLNYSGPDNYNFGGGWASPGSEILLPLGPQHLLYTRIGKSAPMRGETMPAQQAELVRHLMAEHASRLIFALEPDPEIPLLRPRVEDPDEFRRDLEQWERWNEVQSAAEVKMLNDPTFFGTGRSTPIEPG